MDQGKVRVRFAPSPTGPLHIGWVRTALYNYLFARQHGGAMILRIEDTDQGRFVPGAEEYIIEALSWLGIGFDEGVHMGGPCAPYRQSDRKPMYEPYARQLVETGWAYYAFDTPQELESRRKDAEQNGSTFQYDVRTRDGLNNSLSLSPSLLQERLESGTPYVIRFKFPDDTEILVDDLIRGEVRVQSHLLDDKVLFKSDGMPTYHLANIVDDHTMGITHVIRGEEWLPSAPLHVMLYKAFGWEDTMPRFAHLPLLLKPEGNGKLSKRDGDRLGFPVFPLQWKDPVSGEISSGYRESGYYPEAVVNILALMGWNPGTDQELMSMEDLIASFSLDRISKSGARFDLEKAKWFNHQYLLARTDVQLAGDLAPILRVKQVEASPDFVASVCGLLRGRVNFVHEMWAQGSFFFIAPQEYDEQAVRKRWKPETPALLSQLREVLEALPTFTPLDIHEAVAAFVASAQIGMGAVMIPLRIALVGGTFGPDLQDVASLLGRDEVLRRLDRALQVLG